MKIAVVDIGSNTVKMKIYSPDENGINEIYSVVNNAKLISHIKDTQLTAEGIYILCNAINEFKSIAEAKNADIFTCFATASLRKTSNIEQICHTVYQLCQEKIDLVSGDMEAFYSFMGVMRTLPEFPDEAVLLDMGGGSTEIVYHKTGEPRQSESMGFGSLSMYLDHPDNDFDAIEEHAVRYYKKTVVYPKSTKTAILVGGTALAIYKLYCNEYNTEENYVMEYPLLEKLYKKLKAYDDEVVSLLKEQVPHRVTTAVAGLAAYMGIFEELGTQKIIVSTCGIREGYVYEKILKA